MPRPAIIGVTAACLLLVGTACFLWPVGTPVVNAPAEPLAPPVDEPEAARFNSPPLFTRPVTVEPIPEPIVQPEPAPVRHEPPTLIGIALGDPVAIAWFRLPSGEPVSTRVGEVVLGWRVDRIEETEVVLVQDSESRRVPIFGE